MMTTGKSVALYARYSSVKQNELSAEDQLRLCRRYAEQHGWHVVDEYSDAAISGLASDRPDYKRLVDSLPKYDIVLAEALDRLSRDQAEPATLLKLCKFHGVTIVTLSEGEIDPMKVGFKGTMNAVFLDDLAKKTWRGLESKVRLGKSGGGNTFGYRVVTSLSDRGLAVGDREIDEVQAALVVRIFREFVNGESPKAIAKRLNSEGIAGPRRGTWGPSTIHGHPKRGTGILNNELYIGRLIWNRLRYIKRPGTNRRNSRLNPPSQWVTTEVPELRIVSDELWNAAKARQGETRKVLAEGGRLVATRRPVYLFTSLAKCGVCGASYTMASRDRLSCAGARDRGTCTNKTTIRRDELEERLLKAMEEHLWNDEDFEVFCTEFTKERNRLHGEASAAVGNAKRMIAEIDKKLAKWHRWVEEAWDADAQIDTTSERAQIRQLEQEKRLHLATIETAERSQRARPLLHPQMSTVYRQWIRDMKTGLQNEQARPEAMTALRALVQAIRITPGPEQLEITLYGDLAAILAAASPQAEAEDLQRQIKMVAGAGFEPATFGL